MTLFNAFSKLSSSFYLQLSVYSWLYISAILWFEDTSMIGCFFAEWTMKNDVSSIIFNLTPMIGHLPDAAMLAWLSGQVEVGFSSGNVCLLRKRRNTSQTTMENIIEVTSSLIVACTYRQSQFCIELSCSSALSTSFFWFSLRQWTPKFWKTIAITWNGPGWPSTCWLKWTGAGTYTYVLLTKTNHEMIIQMFACLKGSFIGVVLWVP